jgi:hypothetical protein
MHAFDGTPRSGSVALEGVGTSENSLTSVWALPWFGRAVRLGLPALMASASDHSPAWRQLSTDECLPPANCHPPAPCGRVENYAG